MKPVYILVSLWCIVVVSQAQTNCDLTVSGQVIDEHDGSALGYADIYVDGTDLGTISDEFGNYTLPGLCSGEVVLVCSHVGCTPIRDTLFIKGNARHNFYPEHHAEMLEGVNILEKIDAIEPIANQVQVQNIESKSGTTLGNMLTEISGVDALSTGSGISKPIIQGLHSNRVLVLNHGIRQEGQQWGNEHAPEIDPFIAGEVLVIKGASSVKYGPDAIGGVVLVNPLPLPDSLGLGGQAQSMMQSNGRGGSMSAMLQGRHRVLKSFSWRAQGSVKKIGNQHAPDYYLKNTGLEELNFSLSSKLADDNKGIELFYSQFNTNLGILAASHIGNLSDLQRAFEASEPLEPAKFSYTIGRPYQRVEHELTKASGFKKTGDNSRLNIMYGRQYNLRQEFDNHRGLDTTQPGLQYEIITNSLDLNWETRGLKNHLISVGVSGLTQKNTYQGRFFIPNFRKWASGIYAIEKWYATDNWTLEFGTRFDYVLQRIYLWESDEVINHDHTYYQPSVSIGSIIAIGDNWTWKTNLASAWRPPNVSELYSNGLHHGAATVEIGDTTLVKEVSYNGRTSLIYRGDKLTIEAEAYVNYLPSFIYLAPVFPATLTIRGAFPTYAYNQTEALLYGTDNRITYQLMDWMSIESSTSILRARDVSNGNWIVQMPADNSRLALRFNHNTSTTEYFVTPTAHWVNKQWRVPSNSDYISPPEAYLLFHMLAGATHKTKSGEFHLSLEVNNILNTRYRHYLNRYRYFVDEIGRNFTFRISYSF